MRSIAQLLFVFGLLPEGLLAATECRFPATPSNPTITYRFQPEIADGKLVLHVRLEFKMTSAGSETLVIPTHWAGETLHALSNLRVVSKGASLSEGGDTDKKIVNARPKRRVAIAYDLQKDWNGPLVDPLQFHPVLMPEYLEFTGSNAFVRPAFNQGASEVANFDWTQVPASWTVATSFGSSTSMAGRCQTYSGPAIKVDQGLYAAGDYRLRPFQISGKPAILAVRGKWTFTDEDAIAQIQKTIAIVRDFWHDNKFLYFLVTLKPYDRDHGSSDGSQFTNAFWMYVSRLDTLSGLLPQLAHEAFHEWNPGRMGPLPHDYHPIDWFKEGFTDYYANLLLYRAGEMPVADYVESVNRALRRFPESSDEYVRGRVIAIWLDAAIRRESHSAHTLDDVMFEMVRNNGEPITQERLFTTIDRYVSPESGKALRNAVLNQESLAAPERLTAVGACATPGEQELPSFDLGLDLARSQAAYRVTGVIEGGPAFRAGLRDGQVLNGRLSVYKNDPDKMAIFTIRTDTGRREITFLPRGKSEKVWQYRLDTVKACEPLH